MNDTRSRLRLPVAAILSLGLLFAFFGVVSAHTTGAKHAKVTKAIPAIGSTITTAPQKVVVFTAENMKIGTKYSNILVYGPSGALISTGDATFDVNNPQTMSVNIKPEQDGVYIVRWNNVSSDDNDPDQGAFIFTVKAGAVVSVPAKPTSTPTSSSGTPVWVPILVGIVALLIGLGAGVAFASRRSAIATAATTTPDDVLETGKVTQRP